MSHSDVFLTKLLKVKIVYWILLVFILFQSAHSNAQNLCPNGSFENVNPCPGALSQLNNASPWNDPPGSGTTSDLFNACHINSSPVICQDVGVPQNFSGSAVALTGNGYAGILTYYGSLTREYVQAPLDSSLLSGQAYYIEASFRRSTLCHYATNSLGICISTGALSQPGTQNIQASPQIESAGVISNDAAWTTISGVYVATGGENYITLGNFRDNPGTIVVNMGGSTGGCIINASSAYYYIDDVKVERINENVNITGDTLICTGMSTTLTANSNVATWWSTAAQPDDTLSVAGSVTVSPLVSSGYILNGNLVKSTVFVHVVSPPVVNLGNDTTICEGNSVNLEASNTNAFYLWSTGDTSSTIVAADNQTYWVLADNGGCFATDSINLSVLPDPPVDLGLDSVFCLTGPDVLELDAGPGIAWFWLPGGDTTQSLLVSSENTYTVTVTRANGCTAASNISTVEVCPVNAFIPKAFTPDGDGKNDVFIPSLKNSLSFEMRIFNRWGVLLFSTTNSETGWNGKFKGALVPEGPYFFSIRFGSVTDSKRIDRKTITGSVLLLK